MEVQNETAILVVQVGQCGNQVGEEFWRQLLLATENATVSSPFFTRDRKARCVLIDSEPKVVGAVYKRHQNLFRAENVISGQSGRGNHWALGYYGVSNAASLHPPVSRPFQCPKDQRRQDRLLLRDALRAIYAETRRTSDAAAFEAIVVLHSLAGGTGSGMTTCLVEKIRDFFIAPSPAEETPGVDAWEETWRLQEEGLDGMMMERRQARHLITITIAPQVAGELSTQSLNAALTLRALQSFVSAVLLLRNDDCLEVRESSMGEHSKRNTSSSSATGSRLASSLIKPCSTFQEVNEIFVTLLLPILLYGRGANALSELVQTCSPYPEHEHNILTILPIPQRQYLRFRQSVTRSRFYAVSGVKVHMPGVSPGVPLQFIHTSHSLNHLETMSSSVEVRVPKTFQERFAGTRSLRPSSVKMLLQHMEGVLVMNEARDLNASLLFPLLRSAIVKVKAGAFLSIFHEMGMSSEYIQSAIREVAEKLAMAEEL